LQNFGVSRRTQSGPSADLRIARSMRPREEAKMDPTLFGFSYVMRRNHRARQARIDARMADDMGLALPGRLLPAADDGPHAALRRLAAALCRAIRPAGSIRQPKTAVLPGALRQ
jgi:hypothetical protein